MADDRRISETPVRWSFRPIIDLGYSKWTAAQIVTLVLIGLGWLLVTAFIAAFASVLRRGD